MKMLFRMTKMSFVLTMVLYFILASFTNLNASTTQTIMENENVNFNLQEDKITPIEAYFIKDGIKSDKDPNGMYISTIINKEGERLNNLKITLSLKKQIIDNLEITYTKSENDLDTNLKTPKYSLDFDDIFDLYTISFSEEVSQPLKVTIKTKLLIDSILDSATSSQYSITNKIEISASEYKPSLSYDISNTLEGLNFLDLKLESENTSPFKFNLNYKSMDNTKENTIIIHYDNNLQLTEDSIKELNVNKEIRDLTLKDGEIKFTSSSDNLNLSYDLKFKENITINTNTSLHSSASLNGDSLTSSVNFNYMPIIIENSDNIFDIKNSVVGSYEAISKVITWEILTNFQENSGNYNKIETILSPKEKYIEDSLQVKQYKQLIDGSLRYIKDLNTDEYEAVYNNESNNLKLNIKNTEPAVYKVIFKTSLANTVIDYQVDHVSRIYINEETREIKTTITIPYVNLHINKLGKQNKNLVDWTILVNEKQSTLNKVEVVDKLCNNQTYLKDTLKVFKTTVNFDGSYVIDKTPLDKNHYVIKYLENESEGFSLSLVNKQINVPYIITYKTIPRVNQAIRLISRVTLNSLEEAVEVVDYIPKQVDIEEIAPSIPESTKGSYTIYKVDSDNLPLVNVVFLLKSSTDNTIYTSTTNKDGIATFENLDYGSYILKEVVTVPGYIIDQKLLFGIEITIDKNASFDKFINKATILTIKSVSEDLKALSKGVFTLSHKVDNDYIKVFDSFTVNKEIQFKGLVPGKYKLSQIKAVPTYIHNLEEVSFEVLSNQDSSVKFINYKGRVLVYDQYQDEFLTGGNFKIIDLNNNIIDLFTLSQNPHKIDNLAPMAYKLESANPALGYVHIDKSLDFNVENKSYGRPKPTLVYVSSEKILKSENSSKPVNTGINNNKVFYLSLIMATLMVTSQFRRKK